jgi:hypothetical protein
MKRLRRMTGRSIATVFANTSSCHLVVGKETYIAANRQVRLLALILFALLYIA